MIQKEEIIIVPGRAAEGFAEGEEARLAKIIIGRSASPEEKRAALKRLKKIRGMRIPLDHAALQ